MAESKFTADNRAGIVTRVAAGASLQDAARACGVAPQTVKRWITKGKRENGTLYSDFEAEVEQAREAHADQAPMDAAEFRRALDGAVRAGSVQAMKLWADKFMDEGEDTAAPVGKIASLAERRRRRGAA